MQLAASPDPAQLALQAETIADLTAQRTFLLHEREEEHARWAAERESWDRIAEALLAKRRTTGADKDYVSALDHFRSVPGMRSCAFRRLRPLLLIIRNHAVDMFCC